MQWKQIMRRQHLRRAAWGLCAGVAIPGCFTPPGYDRGDTLDFQLPKALAASPATPASRGKDDNQVAQAAVQIPLLPAPTPLAGQPKGVTGPKPLDVPPGVPGAETPQLKVPPAGTTPQARAERLKVIDALFPQMPPLLPDPIVDGVPGAHAVTLEELLEFAIKNSPEMMQASADVADAHGRWVQVGLYPNPTIGFQGDQIFDLGPFGQFGGFFNQTIVTAGKLTLARSVAFFDYLNARVMLKRAEVELTRRVRGYYYAALVAAENVRVDRLIFAFTDEVYRRQVDLVKLGTAAPYEASALLAINSSAELALVQARNNYTAAWKQLAATINSTNLPPAPLAGRVEESLPRYSFEELRDRMLTGHTDIIVARNSVVQAERTISRERARVIPDVQNQFYFEQDTLAKFQGAPNFQMGAQIGITVPLFNRNQGAILSAQALLARAHAEVPRVRNQLTLALTDAFNRYETARRQIVLYREKILPNLVTAFRGVYNRYQVEPDKVNYNDIVTAQQNLVMQLAGYLQALQQQWQAYTDLAGALQFTQPGSILPAPSAPGPNDKGPAVPPVPDSWPEPAPRATVPKDAVPKK